MFFIPSNPVTPRLPSIISGGGQADEGRVSMLCIDYHYQIEIFHFVQNDNGGVLLSPVPKSAIQIPQ